MMGVAVNEIGVPMQDGLFPLVIDIDTDGVTTGLIAIETVFELAVEGDTQVADDVIIQLTFCPFVNPLVVNVGLFVPAFTPFTFH